ncbi:hypothetical protein P153DRAFT_404800, partial [Dothidotthia symphoricarpi CBS 119687]
PKYHHRSGLDVLAETDVHGPGDVTTEKRSDEATRAVHGNLVLPALTVATVAVAEDWFDFDPTLVQWVHSGLVVIAGIALIAPIAPIAWIVVIVVAVVAVVVVAIVAVVAVEKSAILVDGSVCPQSQPVICDNCFVGSHFLRRRDHQRDLTEGVLRYQASMKHQQYKNRWRQVHVSTRYDFDDSPCPSARKHDLKLCLVLRCIVIDFHDVVGA